MVSSEDLAAGISDQDSDMVSLARRIVYLRPQAATINFFPVPLRTTPPSPFRFPSPPSSLSSSSSMARGPSRGVASPALAYPWPTWGISNYYFTDLVTIYIAFSHLLLSPPPPKSWKEVTPAEPPFLRPLLALRCLEEQEETAQGYQDQQPLKRRHHRLLPL